MSRRADQLRGTAERQISELIDLVSGADEPTWQRPCPGREKLGDGTVGAIASHTAANYQRIAAFLAATESMSSGPTATRARHDHASHADRAMPPAVLAQLAAAREAFGRLTELTDRQLDQIPPTDSFRFCDGERTLQQVLAALLKHQDHQIQALRTALAGTT